MSNVWASPVAQTAKNLPAMQETEVWSLGQKGPLEKGMEIHSSIPVWRIPWTEEPSGYSPCSQKELDTAERLTLWLFLSINVQGDTLNTVYLFLENELTFFLSFWVSTFCCAQLLSPVWLFPTPWTVAYQAPLFMGIFQARMLEWVAIHSSRGSSQPDWTQVSHIAGGFSTIWANK